MEKDDIQKIIAEFLKKLEASAPPKGKAKKPKESKKMNKILTFKVKREGKEMVDPRWREVEVENINCPSCVNKEMVVILGHKGILYAYCPRYEKYFVGE